MKAGPAPSSLAHSVAVRAPTARSSWSTSWEHAGSVLPVEATVDDVGRIVLPKALRDRLRLTPGTKVDVSEYGTGLHVVPSGRTARLVDRDGQLVAEADTPITDDDVFGLVDAGRR